VNGTLNRFALLPATSRVGTTTGKPAGARFPAL
jgi:hypothetical protein